MSPRKRARIRSIPLAARSIFQTYSLRRNLAGARKVGEFSRSKATPGNRRSARIRPEFSRTLREMPTAVCQRSCGPRSTRRYALSPSPASDELGRAGRQSKASRTPLPVRVQPNGLWRARWLLRPGSGRLRPESREADNPVVAHITLIDAVSPYLEKAVAPPARVTSAVPPLIPVVRSQARNVTADAIEPVKPAVGLK
jgi:hypothetical protein